MKIVKQAQAGSLESSDCLVTIIPKTEPDYSIEIKSSVYKQFYKQIIQVAEEIIYNLSATNFQMIIEDRGALHFSLKARIETALLRAGGNE